MLEKVEKQQQPNMNKSLKTVIDIFIRYIIGWVYQDSLSPAPSIPNSKLKYYL